MGKLYTQYCTKCFRTKSTHDNLDCKFPDYRNYPQHLQKSDDWIWKKVMSASQITENGSKK